MAMESKVEKEREVEKATYEKAMCTADEVIAHLTKKVDDANKLIPQLEASIEENTGAEAQLARELTNPAFSFAVASCAGAVSAGVF